MAKILGAFLQYYRNEGHYEFMLVFKRRLDGYPVVATVVQVYMTEFNDLLATESKLVDAQKKSPYTAQIVAADHLNDQLTLGIKETVAAALRHYDPTVVAAAVRLNDRLKVFGNISSKSYEEEAAALNILLTDLRSAAFLADVVAVGIGGWIDQLAVSLTNFENLLQQRNDESSVELPQENTKQVRIRIDKVYHKMIKRINAAAELDASGEYDLFIQQFNSDIHYFNEHNVHRTPKKDIRDTVADEIPTQQATGKSITPLPVVRDNDTVLDFAKDYTLDYRDNVKPGNATILIYGKGAYKGKKTVMFNIEAPLAVNNE